MLKVKEKEKEKYHHGELRKAFITAGLKQLVKQPAEKISYRELARQVKVSQTAPYRHFTDKDDFFAEIATEGYSLLREYILKLSKDAPNEQERIFKIGEAYIRFAIKNTNLFRLMFSITSDQKKYHKKLKEAADASFAPIKEAVIAHDGGKSKEQDLAFKMLHAWGLVHGIAGLLIDHQVETISPEQAIASLRQRWRSKD